MSDNQLLSDLYAQAIRYLSFKPRFENEVRLKLQSIVDPNSDSATLIDEIIDKLKSKRYLDDQTLIETIVTSSISKKKGPYWINQKLKLRGLRQSQFQSALNQYYPDQLQIQVVRDLINRRFPTLDRKDPKTKQKLISFLTSRGFPPRIFYHLFDLGADID